MRLMQAVNAQEALLLDALDGHEAHARARGGLADGLRIVGVVLAAVSLQAVGREETGGVHRLNLYHALGQIGPGSCNLVHGLPLCRFGLTSRTQSWHPIPSLDCGKSLRII
jgi:hypothetical protein